MDLIGKKIGSYIVDRMLGAGGTGTVYACKHTMIEREVAVKVLHDEQARDPDQVSRFFQEAKAAADIGHPNIIIIIDYGTLETEDGPRTYVMMESLDGESLDKRLRRGGLSLDDIAHIMVQIVSALVACHSKGVIHRDLKPSNIQLCPRSFDPLFVKLLDFGTAKLAAPLPGSHRTQAGVVIGTPAYMSPEQCEGKGAIDHRSDIYSLGAMLYEMLTGRTPFPGTIAQMLLGHMYRAPEPPSKLNPTVPPEWEALCMRMLEKSREARFQSMMEVAHALDDLRGHAAAYEAFRSARAASGHSGHTQVATPPAGDGTLASGPTIQLGFAQTMAAHRSEFLAEPPPAAVTPPAVFPFATPPAVAGITTPSPADVAKGTPPPGVVHPPVDPTSLCRALVIEPRFTELARLLMLRPAGRWHDVDALARTASVAIPGTLPADLAVSWLAHPTDPGSALVVYVAPATAWTSVVLCPRPRW